MKTGSGTISMCDKCWGNAEYTLKNYPSLLGNCMGYISTTALDVINGIFFCCFLKYRCWDEVSNFTAGYATE